MAANAQSIDQSRTAGIGQREKTAPPLRQSGGTFRRWAGALSAVAAVSLFGAGAAAEGVWQPVANQPNCAVWNEAPQAGETVKWTGKCENGRASGHGTQIWRYRVDGNWKENVYTGTLKNGVPNGRGAYIWALGNKYTGDWKNGKPHGRGHYEWSHGDKYRGEYRDGRPNGRGVFISSNGRSYQGVWRNGCFKSATTWATVGTTMRACGF